MIDVIIPAYNAHEYISYALSSIAAQSMKDKLKVYIVNDSSDKDYSEFVKRYKKDFDITELKTPENVGPGLARQYGIDHSSSEYITFLDADDVFYEYYSIEDLYKFLQRNPQYDVVTSNFIEEHYIVDRIEHNTLNTIWMHGKMYKRKILEENNIRFNDTRKNEDTGFNKLLSLITNYGYLDKITYVWKKNDSKSITRKNNQEYAFTGLEGYFYNVYWACTEAEKRNISPNKIGILAYETMIDIYYIYLRDRLKPNSDYLLKWAKNLKGMYDKYIGSLSEDEIRRSEKKQMNESMIKVKSHDMLNNDISFNKFLELIDKQKM